MKIVEKMQKIHEFINDNPDAGTALANMLQKQSGMAIRGGIESGDWKNYMSNFASNPAQLQRLIGKDDKFNETVWGLDSLAYVVANSTCGMGTTTATIRNMPDEMLDGLDRDVSSDDKEIPDFPKEAERAAKYI